MYYYSLWSCFSQMQSFSFFFQVHLFVVQVISVAKCMSRTSWSEMKERNRASKSKWFSLIYMVKRILLQDFWYIISTKLFFLSLSREWGLLLSQRIKSAKLVFKTERHFPQYSWKFYLSQYFIHDGRDKGSLLLCYCLFLKGFPGGSVVKNPPADAGDRFNPWVGKIPGGGKGNPLQYSCLENLYGQRSLAGYSPWGRNESDMTEYACTSVPENY